MHDLVAKPGAGTPAEGLSIWGADVASVVHAWLHRAGPLVASLQRQKALGEKKRWADAEAARQGHLAAEQENGDTAALRGRAQAKSLGRERGVLEDKGDGAHESGAGSKHRSSAPPIPRESPLFRTWRADDLDRVVAILCLLGGQFESVHPGAKVLCRVPAPSDVASGRESRNIGGARGRWEHGAAQVATVLRTRLLPTVPRDVERATGSVGVPPPAAPPPRGTDGREGRGVDEAGAQRAQPLRPVFASRVISPASGCVRPLDVYDGLASDVRVAVSRAVATAREVETGDTNEGNHQQHQQQRQWPESRDFSGRMPTATLGSVFRGQNRSWAGLQRTWVPTDGNEGRGSRSTTVPARATLSANSVGVAADAIPSGQAGGVCPEWVTLGAVWDGQGRAPHVATVPLGSVTPMVTGVPRALAGALVANVEGFVPQLKALLEVDVAFHGTSCRISGMGLSVVRSKRWVGIEEIDG